MNVVLNSPQGFSTLREARNAFLYKPARTGHDWQLPGIRGRVQKQVLRSEVGLRKCSIEVERRREPVTVSKVLRHKSWVRWHTPVIPPLGR